MPAAAGGYTLAGYSKAADATFFYVPELKIQLVNTSIYSSTISFIRVEYHQIDVDDAS